MVGPLLQTKFYIPPAPPERVPRPRLSERLNVGPGHKLTLLSAPAGFGKTTLLSEWAANLRLECRGGVIPPAGKITPGGASTAPLQFAWLSLDEGDNDPARFLAYLCAALSGGGAGLDPAAGVLGALQSPRPPPTEAILTALINEMAALSQGTHEGRPYVLVLDDYHVIVAQAIHDALTFLLDHLPPQLHLVIATRADPPLPLPRLRLRGELTELRAADLRFTTQEVAALFNGVMGLDLSAEDVAALEARTEGWAAGLQAAALALQGREEPAGFIQAFTGSHRFVLDYLVQEVFERQPPFVQAFLLHTSILDRLSGPLCDAVRFGKAKLQSSSEGTTTLQSSAAMLERLDRANLFIIPLDDERRWYRYHRLFADLLRARLQQTEPSRIPELHRRAAAWYVQNGGLAEAVGHALAAGAFEEAASLVEQAAPETLWARGEVATFLGWLDALPERMARARPRLGLYQVWALLTAAQLDAVEARLPEVERALGEAEKAGTSPAQVREMLGEIAVIRAMAANLRGDVSRAIQLCHHALDVVPEENLFLRTTIAGNLGGASLEAGDVVAASQAFAEASRLSQATGNTWMTGMALIYLAHTQKLLGRLQDAAQSYRQALEQAGPHLTEAMAHVGLGELFYEWNDLDAAIAHLAAGVELGEGRGEVVVGPGSQVRLDGYLALARVRHARGEAARALEALYEAEQAALKLSPLQVAQVAAARARISLVGGDLGAASRWARERGLDLLVAPDSVADDRPEYLREFEALTLARVLLAQGEADTTLGLLVRLGRAAEAAERMRSLVEILALRALAFQALGDTGQAMVALERALALAEPEGCLRTLLDEGAPMEKLLREACLPGQVASEFARRLLAAFSGAKDTALGSRPPLPHAFSLVEPLSPRELEVLRLIADGYSNREIAQRLVIALTTAKKHVSNILGKLGVINRTRAVARARELGLL